MKELLTLVLAVVFVSGAAGQSTAPVTSKLGGPDVIRELKRAPTQVDLQGAVVALTTSLWVNVGPTMPHRVGAPRINGIITAVARNGTLAGKGIRIDHLWLVQGEQVWEASDPEEQDANDPSFTDAKGVPRNQRHSPTFRIALRNGPAWDSKVSIDVVVRLVEFTGTPKLLRVLSQPIGRVQ